MNRERRLKLLKITIPVLFVLAAVPTKAFAYDLENAWSTELQREQWTEGFHAESTTPPTLHWHLMGFLHAINGSFPVENPAGDAILAWLGTHRSQLGIGTGEVIEFVSSSDEAYSVLQNEVLSTRVAVNYRFAVAYNGFRNVGRELVVRFDPDRMVITGVFNGTIPTVSGYALTVPCSDADALTAVADAAGRQVVAISTEFGWVNPEWSNGSAVAQKELMWLFKVTDAEGGVRDAFVRGDDCSVAYLANEFVHLVGQVHNGYSSAGYTYYSNLAGTTSCTSLGGSCTNPAYADSLVSRSAFPLLTDEFELRTQNSTPGAHGWWMPSAWKGVSVVNPFRNGQTSTSLNEALKVTLAAGISACSPYPPPCTNGGKSIMFGPGETDSSVYGHEYAHNLLGRTKRLRSQIGDDGQTTEGMCDIVGVALEDLALQRANVCNKGDNTCLASLPRTDWALESNGASFDLNGVQHSCQQPRGFLHVSFKRAVDSWADALGGRSVLWIRDTAVETMAAAALTAWSITPQEFPTSMDFYAASIALRDAAWVSPYMFLNEELKLSQGADPWCP